MLADYYIVRRQTLDVGALYRHGDVYDGRGGWHLPAVITLVVGGAVASAGQVVPALHALGNVSWFAGIFIGFGLYLGLTCDWQKRSVQIR